MSTDPRPTRSQRVTPVQPVGGLVLRGRPKLKALAAQCPTDAVVTCLTEHEGGNQIVEAVRSLGKEALWLPFTISSITHTDLPRLAAGADRVAVLMRTGSTVTIHCSAGLHRTGIIAYAALRRAGLTDRDAERAIAAARKETADELPRYRDLATILAEWPEPTPPDYL